VARNHDGQYTFGRLVYCVPLSYGSSLKYGNAQMTGIDHNAIDMTIPAQTINQRAYDRLCGLILSGHLGFGERLDERVLAERMKISRTPIREAIGRLATEGIVERRPYQGNFVRTFTSEQIKDLYEVRIELESLAVHLAVARATPADVDELADTIRRCHAAFDADDRIAFEKLDQEFHESIARFSRNETLIDCLENLRLQVQLARHYANDAPDLPQRTIGERNAVLQAFRDKDGETGARHMREHIEHARAAVSTQLPE
jgi:DNA-binding GntR family transcriptional regulator